MTHDPWEFLRQHTSARIALGRSGGSIKTAELLDFRLAHARARDAVHSPFDAEGLARALTALGLDARVARTRARDRQEYLLRPDLGRALDDASRAELAALGHGFDLALVASDGLSAEAMRRNAIPFFTALVPLARQLGLMLSPAVVVSGGRVAVQDEIGELLGARIALIALGERPGLGSADSLGLYFVHDPRPGRTDAERNCISNVREGGLAPAAAARKTLYLIRQALERKLSGVALKDDGGALLPPPK
jgi:ethanolamine ammonia-lyase small subunit